MLQTHVNNDIYNKYCSTSLSLSLFISFLDFMSRIAIIWISSPELSYVCHDYAMPICAPMWAENS